MNTDQEAEALARKIHGKHRLAIGASSFPFDQLLPQHRQGWIETAKLFLQEQKAAKEFLVQAVERSEARGNAQYDRAEKAEASLKAVYDVLAKTTKEAEEIAKALHHESEQRHSWQQRAEKAEAELSRVKHDLHHAKLYGEAKAFEVSKLKAEAMAKPEGIEGTLVEAGTLERHVEEMDFSGLVIAVGKEALRDAKRVPLYCKVRVVEVV